MASHPEAVALFFALSCFPRPVILLPATLRGWQSAPPLPAGTRLVLPPALGNLAGEAARLGLRASVLSDPGISAIADDAPFMSAPGFVFFTSGSTGRPRPVYRTSAQVLEGGLAPSRAVGFPPHGGVIGALPLDRTFGMHHGLMVATVLGRPLALLERFQHHAVLDLFASGEYHYWAGTPVMADALSRCTLPRSAPSPHPAPPICVVSGRLSASVCLAFKARFGVPLRQVYGTTETGAATMDAAPAAGVRSETAGRPLPGVRIRIGDDPRAPSPPGTPGRVWVSSPGCAKGYGFPPDLTPLTDMDGWWASPDVGQLDGDGCLTVAGRLDDCIRTEAGHVVNPAAVAEILEAYPGIAEAVVLPLGAPAGPALGVLLESAQPLDIGEIRAHLARTLPAWSRPRVLDQTRALPRLPSGKPDRLACIAMLGQSPA
jgi:long-chain acyl-CoA synthetase